MNMRGILRRIVLAVRKMIIFGVCLLISLGAVATTSGQEPIEQLAVRLHEGGISFYSVDEAGQFTLLNTLEDFNLSNLSYTAGAEWEIILPSDIVFSPDGQHMAFTAVSDAGDTALFIYTIRQGHMFQTASPGLGALKWSPNSSMLLLVPPEIFTSGMLPNVTDAYLYTLASDTFTQVTNTPDYEDEGFQWLPNGEYIYLVHVGDWTPTRYFNLYIAEPMVQVRELADLETLLMTTEIFLTTNCFPHGKQWSSFEQRLYYAASCDYEPGYNSVLYSVSLQGDNRLEVDLTALYSDDVYTYVKEIYISPSTGHVYALVNANADVTTDSGQLVNGDSWRVLTNRSGQWEILVDEVSHPATAEYSHPAETMQMSPDEQKVAVGGRRPSVGFLAIVDLTTDEVTEHEDDRTVCNIEWVSNERVQYTDFADCNIGWNTIGRTWELDITTGTVEQLTIDLDGTVWLFPKNAR